ncbi:TPA: hypothetical protein ACGIMR_000512 [Salmonella enterica subsp. enterica serovar Javiana]
MNTVIDMNTGSLVETVNETAPTFFASPVAANEDYTDARMTLTELIELVGLTERRDNIVRRMEKLVENGVIQLPQIEEVKNHKNQTVTEYIFEGKKGRIDSIVLVVRSGKGDKAAELVARWDYLENELIKRNESPFPDFTKMDKEDWIRAALECEQENKRLRHEKQQLIGLHVRKSVDAHSMTRLLGEKKGSAKVQRALAALKEAGYIERRVDDSGKPQGYDLLPSAYGFSRMTAHGQLEFTVDVLPVLVNLGVLEAEQKETLRLPQPSNARAIANKTAERIRSNSGSLALVGFDI